MRGPVFICALLATLSFGPAGVASPDPFQSKLDQAKQLRLAGKPDQSEQIVRNVLMQNPGDFRANYTQGVLQLDRGDARSAVATLTSTLKSLKGQPPPDPTIYNTLGYALMRQGRLDEAAAAFQKQYNCGCTTGASKVKLLNNMSLVYRLKGDTAAALKYQQEAGGAQAPVQTMAYRPRAR
jgi:Flp pilus assembly protein TadD